MARQNRQNKGKSKGKIVVLKKLPVGVDNFTNWFKGTMTEVIGLGFYRIAVDLGFGEGDDYVCVGHGYQVKPVVEATFVKELAKPGTDVIIRTFPDKQRVLEDFRVRIYFPVAEGWVDLYQTLHANGLLKKLKKEKKR